MNRPVPPFAFVLPLLLLLGVVARSGAAVPSGLEAREPAVAGLPEELRPWVAWAIDGQEPRLCSWSDGRPDSFSCAWPGPLDLRLDDAGGRFEQVIWLQRETEILLPGGPASWPVDVELDGRPATVILQRAPAVRAGPGEHRLRGRFAWLRLPAGLPVPASTGLVRLELRGEPVPWPRRERDGSLLLADAGVSAAKEESEQAAEISVHRRLRDGAPAGLTTRVLLDVSGPARELLLQRALPEGFTPQELRSPLPARLEPDGRLRVQVRPGRWELWIESWQAEPLTESGMAPASTEPWAPNEVWAFEADPSVRLVQVTGLPPVDQRQTTLPDQWKVLPAWRLLPGDRLRFEQQRRGDEDPAADRLTLRRDLWLDFDGGGWTLRDRLEGELRRSWRLDASPELSLGRVALGGDDQLVTTLPGAPSGGGFELRQGRLSATAESRIESSSRDLPAVGWMQDVEGASVTLHLPPGWRLFTARGADQVRSTWFGRWTLLDLFLWAIGTMAVLRLRGWRWAIVAGFALALTWTEPGAPQWTWLVLLAAVALAEKLPEGRARRVGQALLVLQSLVLAIVLVPFVVRTARLALHPALERWNAGVEGLAQGAPDLEAGAAGLGMPPPVAEEEDLVMPRPGMQKRIVGDVRAMAGELLPSAPPTPAEQRRPEASVPTGPGLPAWRWSTVSIDWSGPVGAEQRLRLLLIPPGVERLLQAARGTLCVLLALGLLLPRVRSVRLGAPAAAAMLLPLSLLLVPGTARAEAPSPEVLAQLRDRALRLPDCAPACAEIESLSVAARSASLTLELTVVARVAVGVPLPWSDRWFPSRVTVDGVEAVLGPHESSVRVLVPPGRHLVRAEGAIPDRPAIGLSFVERPHAVRLDLEGWQADGIGPDGNLESVLQLTRLAEDRPRETADDTLAPGELPPHLTLARRFDLQLTWSVTTTLSREAPTGALAVEIPLLPGEAITTAEPRVEGGRVLVRLPPGSAPLTWRSTLAQSERLELVAPRDVPWSESWQIAAWPNWHVETEGIPPTLEPETPTLRVPTWRPWPGERLVIRATEPPGIVGRTLTVDAAALELSPGARSTDATLSARLRSSRGGTQVLTLPEGAALTRLALDGRELPLHQDGRSVSVPIAPGSQVVELGWRQPDGVGVVMRGPAVSLGAEAVNVSVAMSPPEGRWLLWTRGPRLGPAVLYWSLLCVLIAAAFGLGRLAILPLRWWSWLLLLLGLSQVSVVAAAIVIAWFLVLAWRRDRVPSGSAGLFDLAQVLVVLWTVATLVILFVAIRHGLLDRPEMHVEGNGSSAWRLEWFADRVTDELPRPLVVSAPLTAYRLLMLAWALWLAASLVRWLRLAWQAFSSGGFWRRLRKRRPPKLPAPGTSG